MIFKESFGLCPYLAAMQREQKRNARIRDDEKWRELEMETDIPEAWALMARVKAHVSQRVERQTKNRWVTLAAKAEKQEQWTRKDIRNTFGHAI